MNIHERNHDFILLMYKELDWWHEKSTYKVLYLVIVSGPSTTIIF